MTTAVHTDATHATPTPWQRKRAERFVRRLAKRNAVKDAMVRVHAASEHRK